MTMIESTDISAQEEAPRKLVLTEKENIRFWKRVDKRGDDECWEWRGGLLSKKRLQNYGLTFVNGVKALTHRVSFQIHHRILASGEHVLHKCDNPQCCNPSHLFPGTQRDNNKDRDAKGRGRSPGLLWKLRKPESVPRGSMHKNSVLTEDDVAAIRARYCRRSKNNGLASLAAEFGTCMSNVSCIIKGKGWKHVA